MTKTPTLTELHMILLGAAAQRRDGSLLPWPESVAEAGARLTRAIDVMMRYGLVEQKPVAARKPCWREADGQRFGVAITDAGRAALDGAEGEGQGDKTSPPPTTKIAVVLSLLQREEGATLADLTDATGWLPHTTRAALTGLRKKGHAIAKLKRDTMTCYRIDGAV